MNLQDAFLNQVRVTKAAVSVFLINGHQIKGQISGFDSFMLLIESGGQEQLVYKHAVATVKPLLPLKIMRPDENEAQEPQNE